MYSANKAAANLSRILVGFHRGAGKKEKERKKKKKRKKVSSEAGL